MKSEFACVLAIGFLIGTTGCKKPVMPTASVDSDSESEPAETVAESPAGEPVENLKQSPNSSAAVSEIAAVEAPQKTPDPRTQARVKELEYQIAKLSENLDTAQDTINEAREFHGELVEIFAAEEKKAAAMRAARVFARMRNSSCSG